MRLLPKSEIEKARAQDLKMEIEQGKQIANRVDGLRTLLGEEQAYYEKFRTESLKHLQKDINSKISVRDALDEQIEERKSHLVSLSGPLDKAWKHYVTTERAAIADEKASAQELTARLETEGRKLTSLQGKTEQERKKYVLGTQENVAVRAKAEQFLREAGTTLDTARKEAGVVSLRAHALMEKAEERNLSVLQRQRANDIREQELTKKENELEEREMQVLAKELLYYSPVKKQ